MQDTPPPSKTEPGSAAFTTIRTPRAFEEIAAQIRAELAAGRLQIGSRLPSERALSEQFGVSRNTLREALRSLEQVGLVRLQKGARGGAFISERGGEAVAVGLMDLYHLGSITPAQLTQARIWLEEVVVREACRRATEQQLDALDRNIADAAAAAAAGHFELRARKHLEFHRMLAKISGNPIMIIVMNGVLDVLAHFINELGDQQNPYVLPSRRRMMSHMRARDADAAAAEMTSLLKKLQRSYLSKVKSTR